MFKWWANLFKRSVAATNNAPVKVKDPHSYREEKGVS